MTDEATPASPIDPAPRLPGARTGPSDDPRRSAAALFIATAALTLIADWLFYGHVVGWTAGLYAAALVAGVWAVNPGAQRRRPAVWLTLAAALLVFMLTVEPGPLRILVTAASIVALAITCRLGWTDRPVEWARRVVRFALEGWVRGAVDAQTMRRVGVRRGRSGGKPRVWTLHAGRWVVPVLLSCVFIGLFAAANPLVERWVSEAGTWIGRMPELVEFGRLFMWAMVAVWAWALLRARPIAIKRRRPIGLEWDPAMSRVVPAGRGAPSHTAARPAPLAFAADAVTRCLILFNVVFAVETALDLLVILSNGATLPTGVDYPAYAQRGAYPLVASALLAAVFVLVTFRRGATGPDWRTARRLVFAWLVQNVLLVLSAAWRLNLYVEAFHLTRWRIAAAIWMVLVAVGLLTIVLRIVRDYDNAWLLRANAATLAAVLYACCFFNFDRLIADYNVAHASELGLGSKQADIRYLHSLGHDAIGALDRLAEHADNPDRAEMARRHAADLRADLLNRTTDWRGWTWSRASVTR